MPPLLVILEDETLCRRWEKLSFQALTDNPDGPPHFALNDLPEATDKERQAFADGFMVGYEDLRAPIKKPSSLYERVADQRSSLSQMLEVIHIRASKP